MSLLSWGQLRPLPVREVGKHARGVEEARPNGLQSTD